MNERTNSLRYYELFMKTLRTTKKSYGLIRVLRIESKVCTIEWESNLTTLLAGEVDLSDFHSNSEGFKASVIELFRQSF